MFERIKPGGRIYKTIFIVFICLVLSRVVFDFSGFYMIVAAIMTLKRDVNLSVKYGLNRIFGTFLGGIFGYICLETMVSFSLDKNDFLFILMNVIAIFVLLIFSKAMKFDETEVSIACLVFFSITLLRSSGNIVSYVVARMLETILGVIIAVAVNHIRIKKVSN